MKKLISLLIVAAILLPFSACGTTRDGSAAGSTSTSAQAGQTVGNDQKQATAAETGSASASQNPNVYNIIGAKTVKITSDAEGTVALEAEGAEDATVEISAAQFGNTIQGSENSQSASVSSGSQTGNEGQ